jgi:hypothetical protein
LSYKRGIEGEKQVINTLATLDDQYYLINDVKFPNDIGNIDHVVLGPNGIFAVETKNFSGEILCNGDAWSRLHRSRKRYDLGNPSGQARYNAKIVRKLIGSLPSLKESKIWVDPIVVFTDPNVNLDIKNTETAILKISGLVDCILKHDKYHFSPQKLELMSKEIINACMLGYFDGYINKTTVSVLEKSRKVG